MLSVDREFAIKIKLRVIFHNCTFGGIFNLDHSGFLVIMIYQGHPQMFILIASSCIRSLMKHYT